MVHLFGMFCILLRYFGNFCQITATMRLIWIWMLSVVFFIHPVWLWEWLLYCWLHIFIPLFKSSLSFLSTRRIKTFLFCRVLKQCMIWLTMIWLDLLELNNIVKDQASFDKPKISHFLIDNCKASMFAPFFPWLSLCLITGALCSLSSFSAPLNDLCMLIAVSTKNWPIATCVCLSKIN